MGALLSWLGGAALSFMGQTAKTMGMTLVIISVVFISLWWFGIDMFLELLSMILSFASSMMNSLGLNVPNFDFMYHIRSLPVDVLNLLVLIGFPECLKIILSAFGTRIALNLIPFVRL